MGPVEKTRWGGVWEVVGLRRRHRAAIVGATESIRATKEASRVLPGARRELPVGARQQPGAARNYTPERYVPTASGGEGQTGAAR